MDALEFKTSEHSQQFNRIGNLLIGQNIGEKELYFYVPSDETAMYHVSDWLKDFEIIEINKIRKKYNKPEIYRLARTKSGYVKVNNVHQRKEIEKREFTDEMQHAVLPKVNIENLNKHNMF